MIRQAFLLPAALAVAIGGPYFFSGGGSEQASDSSAEVALEVEQKALQEAEKAVQEAQYVPPVPESIGGPSGYRLQEIFHFGVTVGWIYDHWARVSKAAHRGPLQGYRVALVTGTKMDDLAGVLTYYFDSQHQLREIDFEGSTGDVRRLIHVMRTVYRMESVPAPEPGVHLYQYRAGGRVLGQLRFEAEPEVSSERPWDRFRVSLNFKSRPQRMSFLWSME